VSNFDRIRAWRSRWFRGFGWLWLALLFVIPVFKQLGYVVVSVARDKASLGTALSQALVAALFHSVAFLPLLLALIVVMNLDLSTGRRALVFAITALAGSAVGQQLHWWMFSLIGVDSLLPPHVAESGWRLLMAKIGIWLYASSELGIYVVLWLFYRRDADAAAKLHQAALDRVQGERQMAEARLQLMQAQIEPHFLFNTLANVRRLYETNASAARSMLSHLRSYLGAALPQMRASTSTLESEGALTLAYLNVQKIRMGARLRFYIDLPASLRPAAVPPLMLVSLVENAIKHGLAPLPEGGAIRVTARETQQGLFLQVIDNGAGLTKASGAGVGLANIRMRLSSLYGSRGRLLVEQNAPSGVTATIELPLEVPVAEAAAA
jgi:signal transduction histidine kinase